MSFFKSKRFERSHFIVEKTEHKPKSRLKTVYFDNDNTIQKNLKCTHDQTDSNKKHYFKMNAKTCN